MTKAVFIWQLPKREQLKYYKGIKSYLLKENEYSYEKLVEAMSDKIVALPYDLI